MALPVTIVSFAACEGYYPPFISSNGDVYVVLRTTGTMIDAYKATDPTDSFTAQDTGNNPATAGDTIFRLTAVQRSDVIHLASIQGTGVIEYHEFNMAADTWTTTDELIEDVTAQAPDQLWVSIAVRDDGDVIVGYNGLTDNVKGDRKERVDYARRESGSWGGNIGIALDSGGDNHYGNPTVVQSATSDEMHFQWSETGTTTDPPADPSNWNDTEARTLDPSNNLTTRINEATNINANLLGWAMGVSYDDGGTTRIIYTGIRRDQSGTPINFRFFQRWTEDGSLDIQFDANTQISTGDEPRTDGEVGPQSIAVLGTDLHQLYSGGGTAGSERDIYYSTSTDDAATWTTPTEEVDGIDSDIHLSVNIYVRDAATILAYLYDDGNVQKYGEKVLIEAPVPILPFFNKSRTIDYKTNILLRM